MKKSAIYMMLAVLAGCASPAGKGGDELEFVRVEDGKFMIGDSVYRFVGTNFWYGPILASEGRGGNRERLAAELDALQDMGINNLRILAGADGEENMPTHIMPVLQTAPGVYNDTLLAGLDYLMAELEKRDMKAVIYLNNAWEWSGGYGTYLEWAGAGKAPDPNLDGYREYVDHVAQFVVNDSAKQMAADHVKYIVSRTNRYTGKPYKESPAIMAWQICNEPRPFARDSVTKEAFAQWIASQAALIKSVDANHLVSTGSEGKYGCEYDIDLWARIHGDENIDYGLIHLWPKNWGWVNDKTLGDSLEVACRESYEYVRPHRELMNRAGKPLVLEEFGYPRDGFSFDPASETSARDRFYEYVFVLMNNDNLFDGCNFWGWGGYAVPADTHWQYGADYTCDPAHEPQGMYSVFAGDSTTIGIIRGAAKACVTAE